MKLTRLVTMLISCLLLIGTGWAQRHSDKSSDIELLASDTFAVGYAKVVNIGHHPHLQYSITNTSGNLASALTATLTAYNAKGKIYSRQRWVIPGDLANASKIEATLATNLDIKSATRLTLEFAPASLDACSDSFCTTCAKDARDTCGEGKVKSVSCRVGETCTCDFECKSNLE
jgi:hypothetical protein